MMSASDWEACWLHTGIVLMVVSTGFYLFRLFNAKRMIHEFAWGFMALALFSLMLSLYFRSQAAQYFALSNMYESMLVVCMGMMLGFLCVDRWFKLRAFGLPVGLLLGGALMFDLSLSREIHPLQPALQSYWRSIHVPIILMSYALFTLAFLSSLVFLIKYYWQQNRQASASLVKKLTQPGGGQQPALAAGLADTRDTIISDTTLALDLNQQVALISEKEQANIYDEITYRCVAFGFPMLTVGIILGGIWANEAWGSYWSWDPKESMSLVTLLAYGAYLHLRVNREHTPKTLAWVSVAGFLLMLVTYFGVNLMGVGLHSYGKIG